ncbi:MAG: type II toxin-antitoxin system prevent-host-death family antitoxin [Campylobacterota bacterium]|nr:type II toxin-antitoxin system prevent-host-death family antitoxin [Campylobacterota bacterium]
MQVVSLTEARNNLKAVFDSVYLDNDEVIIHRKGKENVVVISMDEYNSMKETNYLLSNPKNAQRLEESIKQLRDGKGKEKRLIECD